MRFRQIWNLMVLVSYTVGGNADYLGEIFLDLYKYPLTKKQKKKKGKRKEKKNYGKINRGWQETKFNIGKQK